MGGPEIPTRFERRCEPKLCRRKEALEAKAKERIEAEKQKLEERAKEALGDALPDVKKRGRCPEKRIGKAALRAALLKLLGNN